MIATLAPYPEMRDSGVAWLGEVPKHWEVLRLATLTDMRTSNVDKHVKHGEHPVRLCNYLDVYHNDRISADVPFMAGFGHETRDSEVPTSRRGCPNHEGFRGLEGHRSASFG